MSRQQMLHVTVITYHTQALKRYLKLKIKNIYVYIEIEIVIYHILKKFIIMFCFQTNVTVFIIHRYAFAALVFCTSCSIKRQTK